jgi:DNA polymerase-3 subunit epsilon
VKNPFRRRVATEPSYFDDQPLAGLWCAVIDCEMTGLHPRHGDRIVSIAAVQVVGAVVVLNDPFATLVDPKRPIPLETTLIHGITDQDVVGAPRASAAVAALRGFVDDAPIVGHQISFDLAFLEPTVRRARIEPFPPALDIMLLSAVLWPQRGVLHGLDAISERLGVRVHGRHTALGDAIATAECLTHMFPLLDDMEITTFGEALRVSRSTSLARQIDAMGWD